MSATTFRCHAGEFTLLRRPPAPGQPLQAWDAADEYLLTALDSGTPYAERVAPEHRVLVVNDQFGALAIALHGGSVHSWSDSITAQLATHDNLRRNELADTIHYVPATTLPDGRFDSVLWRLPKTQALLLQQAALLRRCVDSDTRVFAAGMQKHLLPNCADILRTLGAVDIWPGQKKARVFQVTPDPQTQLAAAEQNRPLAVAEYDLQLQAGPNVFARDKLDIGARFFIEQFAQLPRAQRIADLGCGNGVLGILAARAQPAAAVHFFDESYQAVEAAAHNAAENVRDAVAGALQFHVDDGLSHYSGEPFDLILCNPPFHQGHSIGDHIAWQLFRQSRRQLRAGGELWIVGNRHLQYHVKLKKLFGNCRQVAANPKFVVLAARV